MSDAPGENLARFGITPESLKITVSMSDGASAGLVVGGGFDASGAGLVYAKTPDSDAVFGIDRDVASLADTDFLRYRSKIVEMLPEKAVLTSVKISKGGAELFALNAKNGDFSEAVSKLDARTRAAAEKIVNSVKLFAVKNYADCAFDANGVSVGGKTVPWEYALSAEFEVRGTGRKRLRNARLEVHKTPRRTHPVRAVRRFRVRADGGFRRRAFRIYARLGRFRRAAQARSRSSAQK